MGDNMNKVSFAIGVLLALMLTGCGKPDRVEGEVKDAFGRPLSDVAVEVEKSTFSAKTDKLGRYSVDYAPGAFSLKFRKAGYTTIRLDLDIQQKAHFPAQPIVLYPLPNEEGFYYLNTNDLLKLERANIAEQEVKEQQGWFSLKTHWRYLAQPGSKIPVLHAKKLVFIDKVPRPLFLVRLGESGLVWEGVLGAFKDSERKDIYFNPIKDTTEVIGEEKLQVRSIELPPASYAWVEARQSISVGILPKFDGILFPFRVADASGQGSAKFEDMKTGIPVVSPSEATPTPTETMPPPTQTEMSEEEDEGCGECAGEEQQKTEIATSMPQERAETPVILPGTIYVSETIIPDNPGLGGLIERRVLSRENGKLTVSATNLKSKTSKPRLLEFTTDWNLISSRNTDGSGSNFMPPVKYFDFPLYPGKTWRDKTMEANIKTGATRQHVITATVGDWETVSVPAGTFKGIKVSLETELTDIATGEKTTGTDISWYVPKVGRSVKSVTSSRSAEGKEQQQIIQLISYKPATVGQ